MSFPTFGDFDEDLRDIFGKDFDLKYTFKSKANGPRNTSFTSTSEYINNKIEGKFGLKWKGPSGLTFDKVELSKDGAVTSEISYSGIVPALKSELKLKGTSGSLDFTYKVPAATAFASVDINKPTKNLSVSLFAGKNGINAGAEVLIDGNNKALSGYNFALGYTANPKLNLAVRACEKLSSFSANVSFVVNDDLTVATKAEYDTTKKSQNANLAAIYKCNPNTIMKVKAASSGEFEASAKQQVDKLSITAAVKIQKNSVSAPSFGLNMVLG